MNDENNNYRATGAVLNEPDNRDIHIVAAVGVTASHPAKNITDISALPVENQLAHGSCVGQAEGKGAEHREYKESGVFTRLSKRDLYAQCKREDGNPFGQGTQPRIAAKILTSRGIAKALLVVDDNTLPYLDYLAVPITDEILTDASTYRAKGFAFGYNLDDIKTAIDVEGVMNATMQCDVSLWNTLPVKPSARQEYHRVLFYGYEDANNAGRPDTKIYYRNSWGEGWGNGGNGWFWYSEYAAFLFDMVVYTDMPNEVINHAKKQAYIFASDLELGMTGTAVMELQKRLFKELAADGLPCFRYPNATTPTFTNYFGTYTRDAVKRYQSKNGIAGLFTPGYGRVGPKTRAALNAGGSAASMTLVDALIQVESGGNAYAIGDKHLVNHAYGPLQIRLPVCIDVNNALGTAYKPEDMLGNRDLSIKVFEEYMKLYATARAIGRAVTDEDKARIWNGGPTGWKKASTVGYWSKVQAALNGVAVGSPLSEQRLETANR